MNAQNIRNHSNSVAFRPEPQSSNVIDKAIADCFLDPEDEDEDKKSYVSNNSVVHVEQNAFMPSDYVREAYSIDSDASPIDSYSNVTHYASDVSHVDSVDEEECILDDYFNNYSHANDNDVITSDSSVNDVVTRDSSVNDVVTSDSSVNDTELDNQVTINLANTLEDEFVDPSYDELTARYKIEAKFYFLYERILGSHKCTVSPTDWCSFKSILINHSSDIPQNMSRDVRYYLQQLLLRKKSEYHINLPLSHEVQANGGAFSTYNANDKADKVYDYFLNAAKSEAVTSYFEILYDEIFNLFNQGQVSAVDWCEIKGLIINHSDQIKSKYLRGIDFYYQQLLNRNMQYNANSFNYCEVNLSLAVFSTYHVYQQYNGMGNIINYQRNLTSDLNLDFICFDLSLFGC